MVRGDDGRRRRRLAECAAARVRRVLLQHQLWIDLEMVAAIGAEIFPHVRDL
jgi:hypothetical protein